MARKPTDKQLFKMKNEWLGQFYEEVKPKDFYRAVFPEGSFEREGHPEDEKCNGVLTVIEGEKARNYIVFDELNMVDEVKGAEFAIMSPVGYSGRNRTAKNARWLYGIAVDLDGVEMEQLRDVFHQMKHDFLPQCTYCVNSGHGLHLYYLFEKPVPLYRHLQDQLREFKYELIRKIWNRYTSTYTEREQVQYQRATAKYLDQKKELDRKFKAQTASYDSFLLGLLLYGVLTTVFTAVRSEAFVSDFKTFFMVIWQFIVNAFQLLLKGGQWASQLGDKIPQPVVATIVHYLLLIVFVGGIAIGVGFLKLLCKHLFSQLLS